MHKQDILESVFKFCDEHQGLPNWRGDSSKDGLFAVFVAAQESAEPIPADVIQVDLRQRLERLGKWDVPMQSFVTDLCETWSQWEYAIKHFTATQVDVGGSG